MFNYQYKAGRRDTLKNISRYIFYFALGAFLIPVNRFLNRLQPKKRRFLLKRQNLVEGINTFPDVIVFKRGEQIRLFSRRCPHLGCDVQMNPTAKELVCPCHGSRFTAQGRYLSGPARKDLSELSFKPINRGEWEVEL
ncbi:MAG TPA: Rieske (2Fe-2S) protein [Calditrichaeota bacterium]|nr:Rieske (2Fe-2S) protein [Calditrichota bacterium]